MHRSYSQTGGWNIPLSALGGGEGRGEVGGPPSRTAELPTSPSRRTTPGPSLSPRKRAERGKGSRLDRYQPNMCACPGAEAGAQGGKQGAWWPWMPAFRGHDGKPAG